MNPEKPKSELDEALERLGENVRKREDERKYRNFETDTGFHGSVEFYKDGLRNLRLSQSGQTSLFTVDANGVRLMEFRGADDEHLDEPQLSSKHIEEAWRLYESGDLEQHKSDENGQFEMDI